MADEVSWQEKLKSYATDKGVAQQELLRTKNIYNQEYNTASQERLGQIHDWADMVRQAAGINDSDVTYGNNNGVSPEVQAKLTATKLKEAAGFSPGQTTATSTASPAGYQSTYHGPDIAGMTQRMNGIYDSRKSSALTGIQNSRDTALQGYNAQETTAKQQATGQRNQSDVMNMQAAQKLRESMANMGLLASGDNITAQSQLAGQRQAAIGAINQQETGTLQDIAQKRGLLQSQAASQEQALSDQIEADRAAGLLDLEKYGDERAFQVDNVGYGRYQDTLNNQFRQDQADITNRMQEGQLTGVYQGMKTAAQANADRSYDLQKQGQDNSYTMQMAQLTGYLPNGQPTSSEQQRVMGNLWQLADAAGIIPNDLADMYGLPRGTQTLQAKQVASSINAQNASISNQNADNSRAENNANLDRLFKIWQASGEAPAGIPGVAAGTQLYQKEQPAKGPSKNDLQSDYIAGFEKLTPEKRKEVFSKEKATIVKDLGTAGYNALFNMYFNQDGSPK